jgi:hypothetical protein
MKKRNSRKDLPACIATRNAFVLLRAPVCAKRCGQVFA